MGRRASEHNLPRLQEPRNLSGRGLPRYPFPIPPKVYRVGSKVQSTCLYFFICSFRYPTLDTLSFWPPYTSFSYFGSRPGKDTAFHFPVSPCKSSLWDPFGQAPRVHRTPTPLFLTFNPFIRTAVHLVPCLEGRSFTSDLYPVIVAVVLGDFLLVSCHGGSYSP